MTIKWEADLAGLLADIVGEGQIKTDILMKDYTSFKVGGHVPVLVFPESVENLREIFTLCINRRKHCFVMGNGSNLLVSDDGYDGVILKLGDRFGAISVLGTVIEAQAGALLSTVSRVALKNSLSGMEFASGIPGSIGGAVYMNAGAYGGEMKDIIIDATVMDPEGNVRVVTADDMKLGYRHSIFQETGEVILSCRFQLQKGVQDEIAQQMKELNQKRNQKQPVTLPSAGSVFKRPEGHFAGQLIEDAGLKGLKHGGASVSTLHAGFIVNEGNATAKDILSLIHLIQEMVFDRSGVRLVPELKMLGF